MRNALRRYSFMLVALLLLGLAPRVHADTGFRVPIVATNADGATFSGTFRAQSYQVLGQQLVAIGTLSGTVSVAGSSQPAVETVVVPVTLTATPQALSLTIGPVTVTLAGEEFTFAASFQVTARNALESRLFSAIAAFLAMPGSLGKIAYYLNLLLLLGR